MALVRTSAAAAAALTSSKTSLPKKKSIVSSLYRSLLRVSKHFDNPSPGHGAVLSSLLHQTGYVDDIDEYFARLGSISRAAKGIDDEELSDEEKSKISEMHLSQEQARDLTRGYCELKRLKYERTKAARAGADRDPLFDEDGEDATRPPSFEEVLGGSMHRNRPPHAVLFRQILNDYMGGGENGNALMRFPSQISASRGSNMMNLSEHIRKEFRAPELQSPSSSSSDGNPAVEKPISSRFENSVRMEAAFLALRELNKKLVWAEKLGFDFDKADGGINKTEDNSAFHESKRKQNRAQAAQGVQQLPISKPSSYLRSGSYLVAHPLLSGYFHRAVIVILDHTEQGTGGGKNGGTYGLIVNKESRIRSPKTSSSSSQKESHWRRLRDVIQVERLPERLREAFGDSPVRDGGPVNPSVQMMHACSPEEESRYDIGGDVLPMIELDDIVGGEKEIQDDTGRGDDGPIVSPAMHTDEAVYYQGDIIRAAEAVIEGDMKRDDFSFVIGASCWEVGQLESEIARGYWLPCKGPPRMAFSGMCQHEEYNDNGNTGFEPKNDLWLSMMCALGEEEGDLAHMFLDNEYDENGEACDDF